MTHRADDGVPAADREFEVAGDDYHQSLPVFDKDADDGPPPLTRPDGSPWEPEDSGDDWEEEVRRRPGRGRRGHPGAHGGAVRGGEGRGQVPEDPPVADSV